MIAHIKGKVDSLQKGKVIVDVAGIGYLLNIPSSSDYENLKADMSIKFYTHLNSTESGLDLYGFLSEREKDLFLMLTAISSFGPKLALSIISSMPPSELAYAVASGNKPLLKKIPGLGDKKAERLMLELKGNEALSTLLSDKKEGRTFQSELDFDYSPVLEVLESLGCTSAEAMMAVRKASSLYKSSNNDELLVNTMKVLEGK